MGVLARELTAFLELAGECIISLLLLLIAGLDLTIVIVLCLGCGWSVSVLVLTSGFGLDCRFFFFGSDFVGGSSLVAFDLGFKWYPIE